VFGFWNEAIYFVTLTFLVGSAETNQKLIKPLKIEKIKISNELSLVVLIYLGFELTAFFERIPCTPDACHRQGRLDGLPACPGDGSRHGTVSHRHANRRSWCAGRA
jgi:hypothetical protein